jgi:hypothetical protein
MRDTPRKLLLWSVLAVVTAGTVVHAAETLRIVPLISDDTVLVSVELSDAYTEDVREAIASGLRTTFTYEVELRQVVPAWVDRTITTAVVSTLDQYDNLTRQHSLSLMIDGRVQDVLVTEDEAAVEKWLTVFTRLPLYRASRLEANRDYYVRIRARVRPRGTSLLGWTGGINGQARFTFIP